MIYYLKNYFYPEVKEEEVISFPWKVFMIVASLIILYYYISPIIGCIICSLVSYNTLNYLINDKLRRQLNHLKDDKFQIIFIYSSIICFLLGGYIGYIYNLLLTIILSIIIGIFNASLCFFLISISFN